MSAKKRPFFDTANDGPIDRAFVATMRQLWGEFLSATSGDGLAYLKTQCPQEVKLERVPSATYHCLLRAGHDGACVISVIGSDAFHEALER